MDHNIAAHFSGIETSNHPMKSIIFTVEDGTKSALTKSLEKFKKEVNTYLTECIEKNKTTSSQVDSCAVNDEELDSDEDDNENMASTRPNKVPKLV
ncbi:hypothetical protein DAPPUDRAFT_311454 [Daphnia pulex]|uniref:Uncharacterized protein n=1 Tax=Daphnia pulex TaxID=6669 RepID=E9FWY2_DAPPU|nr:hypothetical protein DAPPUDRAFT_311454 [Daphnia pulex]|eukprot:EFX88355.1 hypothetical protein DAPPUDRAFT_311454 [Daphnia pulex]